MVLEGASTNDFGDNAVPSSDGDKYDSNSESSQSIRLELIRTPWTSRNYIEKSVSFNLQRTAAVLERRPTPDEANFVAHWTSKLIAIQSFSTPIGVTAGVWRAYTTRATYKFPLFTPNLETLKPNEFFPNPRFPILTGANARMAWHGLRASLYASTGYVLAGVFLLSYGLSVCATGAANDPRGKAIREAVNRRRASIIPFAYVDLEELRKMQQEQQSAGQNGQTQSRVSEDGSATVTPENTPYSNDGMTTNNPFPSPPMVSMASNTTRSSATTDEFFDMSQTPDNRAPQSNPYQSTLTSTTGGSAWERLRKQSSQGARGVPERPRDPAAEAPRDYDAYSPARKEEDTEAQRERAQREFDARIEQERRGGDFSEGKGGFKRW